MPRPLKVLHLVSNAGPNPYLRALADFIDRDAIELACGSLGPAGRLQADMAERQIATFALDCTRRLDWPAQTLRLAERLRVERIDIVQTHLLEASLVGLSAARIAGTPVGIFTGHHSHETMLYPGTKTFFLDCLCSRALSHQVLALSVAMKETFVHGQGVPREKIAVIPHPFNFANWRFRSDGRKRVRSELGIDGKTVLGAVGRLWWVKDFPSLLHAFAAACRLPDGEALVLLLVGEGPDRAALGELAAALGIDRRVSFLGHRQDMVDVMSAMDLFVHPSIDESFGQVIVEAFAVGRPVVATDVGIVPEIIENGVSGYRVPPRDTGALTHALATMLEARSRWSEMGEKGRERVQPFAAERIAPAYEAQYREWASEAAGGSSVLLSQPPPRPIPNAAAPLAALGARVKR